MDTLLGLFRKKTQLSTSHFGCKLVSQAVNAYFTERKKLGEGGFGTVYKVKVTALAKAEFDPELPEFIALKHLKINKTMDKEVIRNEIIILRATKCQHVAKYYGCLEYHNNVYIAMELIPGVTLSDLIKGRTKITTSQKHAIVRELALAIDELHSEDITHRDLKPENIMITEDAPYLKIIDFGLACYGVIKSKICQHHVGTDIYIDNDLRPGDIASLKLADWWAFGQIVCNIYKEELSDTAYGSRDVLSLIRGGLPSDKVPVLQALLGNSHSQEDRPRPYELMRSFA